MALNLIALVGGPRLTCGAAARPPRCAAVRFHRFGDGEISRSIRVHRDEFFPRPPLSAARLLLQFVRPASTAEISFVDGRRRCWPLAWMSLEYSLSAGTAWGCRTVRPSSLRRDPRTRRRAFAASWLIVARSRDFARFALSTRRRASSEFSLACSARRSASLFPLEDDMFSEPTRAAQRATIRRSPMTPIDQRHRRQAPPRRTRRVRRITPTIIGDMPAAMGGNAAAAATRHGRTAACADDGEALARRGRFFEQRDDEIGPAEPLSAVEADSRATRRRLFLVAAVEKAIRARIADQIAQAVKPVQVASGQRRPRPRRFAQTPTLWSPASA